ncbi:MAG: methyltransferase domain-containing protein [Flavobacteriaceae bacterium]|nr:methyltransferase domain-containing protein [Flavobacteriaceae bacterium]MCY4217000.1 methyltransferase domain-containing protein [Flavobacteriaceae bacterium]
MKWILRLFPRVVLITVGEWIRPILKILCSGRKYTDPIDQSRYRIFLGYGHGKNYRKKVLCPGTFSLERHRLLWLYMKNKTDLLDRKLKVLHFAPEPPLLKQFKEIQNWDYTTADLTSPLADLKVDLCHLPFDDQTFDLIMCNHVLEHIENDAQAMRELYRILTITGILIAMVPLNSKSKTTYENPQIKSKKMRKKHFGQYDHVRVYGMDYKIRLEKKGFHVEFINYASELKQSELERYRLDFEEIIPIAIKRV